MEIWDGYYKDGTLAGVDLVRGEKIPEGLYHIACEALVWHTDGSFLLMQRDLNKETYPGFYEASAGGSALKGETPLECIKREIFEETGIKTDDITEAGHGTTPGSRCIHYSYVCRTDCDKTAVRLQKGETISYKWISLQELLAFITSDKIIDRHKDHYERYLNVIGNIF
ncbi:MAG: NUDIX domain-containing protein [Clostridiales bacterium]|nr:NUDIX domain-containing protein [Clostridiales bacterium]